MRSREIARIAKIAKIEKQNLTTDNTDQHWIRTKLKGKALPLINADDADQEEMPGIAVIAEIGKPKTILPQISLMSADQKRPRTFTTKDTKEHKGRTFTTEDTGNRRHRA